MSPLPVTLRPNQLLIARGVTRVRHALLAALSAAALATIAAPASAATTINANWDTSCGSSDCFTGSRYTHTWSANGASGPITVGRLLLDRGILGDLDGQVFRLSFQLNGQEVGSWGSFMMSQIGGDELNFWGENFTWNPEDGDLTLVLEIDWDAARGGGIFGPHTPTSGGGGNHGGGHGGTPGDDGEPPALPVSVEPIPEPGAWALMIVGLGAAGATLRRRRALLGA